METRDRTVVVAVITGLVALLLGCCLGALVAGLGGYAIGRQAAAQMSERISPITPELPNLPEIPAIPGPQTPPMSGIGGAMVQEVINGSPADKAGLKSGDMITAVESTPVDENHSLADILGGYKPGAQVALEIWRMNETIAIKVELGENPDKKGQPYLGVRYVDFAMLRNAPSPSD
jgi:S1-C subfamily serine protease